MLRLLRSLIGFSEQIAVIDTATEGLRRLATYIGLGMVVLLLLLASVGAAVSSLWIWAAVRFGEWQAALIVAGALAGLALLLILVMTVQWRRARARRARNAARALQGVAQAPARLFTLAANGFLAGLAGSERSKAV